MEMLLLNTASGLKPCYDNDYDEKKKLKIGKTYRVTITEAKERNILFHRKFFALIKIGCENSKSIDAPLEVYRKYALIKSGFAKIYITQKGQFAEADSISFNNMTQERFEEVYNRVLDFIIQDTQANREMIEKELLSFM